MSVLWSKASQPQSRTAGSHLRICHHLVLQDFIKNRVFYESHFFRMWFSGEPLKRHSCSYFGCCHRREEQRGRGTWETSSGLPFSQQGETELMRQLFRALRRGGLDRRVRISPRYTGRRQVEEVASEGIKEAQIICVLTPLTVRKKLCTDPFIFSRHFHSRGLKGQTG